MEAQNSENINEVLRKAILGDFTPITPIIYTVLETAQSIVPECVDLFVKRCKKGPDFEVIKKRLYPTLMRSLMQILLNSQDLKTQATLEIDGKPSIDEWERIILSNNGLAGSYADRDYILLKAKWSHGEILLPPPKSRRKKQYYCQKHLMEPKLPLFPGETLVPKHNAIYLWDASDNLVMLWLSCPKWGNSTYAEPYFIEPIEHPVLSIPPNVHPEDVVQELDLEKVENDINISLDGEIKDNSQDGEIQDADGNDEDLREKN